MKKGFFQSLIFMALLGPLIPISLAKELAELQSIHFRQKGEISRLEMIFDQENVVVKRHHISEDKQVVVDLKDVKASEKVMRAFDTSEFSGAIVFVSAYQKRGDPTGIRVTLQLRDNVRSLLKRDSKRVVLEVENRFGVFNQQQIFNASKIGNKITYEKEGEGKFHVPKSNSLEDILENLTLSGRKKYIGKRISLDINEVAVEDVLKMIAEASGFNIILTEGIKRLPPLTLNLTKIPWDQALDTILDLNKLVAEKNGIILTVKSLARATKDRQDEINNRNLKKEPIVTKIFPISYATSKDLISILKEYLTKGRGSLAEDVRTNSLIIRDTALVIERIRKIIEVLDTQTPQVLIESKIVEVNEGYSKKIGLNNGFRFGYDPVATTVGENGGPGFSFNSAPVGSGGGPAPSVFGLEVTRFGRLTGLNFQLQVLESESKGKIISSPKIVTQNKKKAVLKSTKNNAFPISKEKDGKTEITYEEVQAQIQLDVTPQITNEGSIILEMNLVKEDFGDRLFPNGPPRKTGNNITTNVLVENGSTIVLGGLYEYDKREEVAGIPILKDLPLLGWLFRTADAPESLKREVIIFITPRIINQEEAGLIERG